VDGNESELNDGSTWKGMAFNYLSGPGALRLGARQQQESQLPIADPWPDHRLASHAFDPTLEYLDAATDPNARADDLRTKDAGLLPGLDDVDTSRPLRTEECGQVARVQASSWRTTRAYTAMPEYGEVRLQGLRLRRPRAADRQTAASRFGGCELVVADTVGKSGAGLDSSLGSEAMEDVPRGAAIEVERRDHRPERNPVEPDVGEDALVSFGVLVHHQSS
jgi:hypothetical protein